MDSGRNLIYLVAPGVYHLLYIGRVDPCSANYRGRGNRHTIAARQADLVDLEDQKY